MGDCFSPSRHSPSMPLYMLIEISFKLIFSYFSSGKSSRSVLFEGVRAVVALLDPNKESALKLVTEKDTQGRSKIFIFTRLRVTWLYTPDYFWLQRSVKLMLQKKIQKKTPYQGPTSSSVYWFYFQLSRKIVEQSTVFLPKSNLNQTLTYLVSCSNSEVWLFAAVWSWPICNCPGWNFWPSSSAFRYTIPNRAFNCIFWNVDIFGTFFHSQGHLGEKK